MSRKQKSQAASRLVSSESFLLGYLQTSIFSAFLCGYPFVHVYISISLQGQHHVELGHITMTSLILSALLTPNMSGAEILGFRTLMYGCGGRSHGSAIIVHKGIK